MKKTMTGMLAYSKMMSIRLPEKTGTYTPIAHADIIHKVRSEILDAGFIITREEYSCTSEGNVAVGSFGLVYKVDKDIELCANFMNSYNKRYAFRFSLGGVIKKNNAVFMVSDAAHGSFKRMHTGLADLMSSHKIKEFIDNAGGYWDSLKEVKDLMTSVYSNRDDLYRKVGQLFFEKKILNTFQLNLIREEYEKISAEAEKNEENITLWDVYSAVTFGVREGNPTTWMNDLEAIHDSFNDLIDAHRHLMGIMAEKVSKSTMATEESVKIFERMEELMITSSLVDAVNFNTDPVEIPKEDNPNVLRVSYQPSDEEISALKAAGIEVIVDFVDFEQQDELEEFDEMDFDPFRELKPVTTSSYYNSDDPFESGVS